MFGFFFFGEKKQTTNLRPAVQERLIWKRLWTAAHHLWRMFGAVPNALYCRLSFSATQFWRSKVLEVAKDFPEYTFAIADEEDYSEELKTLGLSESGEEVNVGIMAEGGKKFAMEPDDFDSEVLRDFVVAFKKGELFCFCNKKTSLISVE